MERINVQPIYSNYKRDNKFFGIIDYKSLYVCVCYAFVVFMICRMLPISMEFAIYLFMFLVIPVVAILCVNINNDSAIDVLFTIINFLIKRKLYVRKEFEKDFKACIFVKNKSKK